MTKKYDDYKEQSSDLKGIWKANEARLPEGEPLHFIPREAVLSDSKKFDKTKPSVLIIGELVDACLLVRMGEVDDEGGDLVEGEPGDLVGVWYKPGMRALADLAGVKVLLDLKRDENGDFVEKDVDKGNPMKLYSVRSPSKGRRLPIKGDYREKSKNAATFLTPAARDGRTSNEPIPF